MSPKHTARWVQAVPPPDDNDSNLDAEEVVDGPPNADRWAPIRVKLQKNASFVWTEGHFRKEVRRGSKRAVCCHAPCKQ